jgi:Domain of unknown function (DUF4386)
MTNPMLEIPARAKSRIAGALYLLCIASGFFAELCVRSKLIVWNDAAATAGNILASPTLYRVGFFADLTAMGCGVLVSVIFYDLLKPVNRSLALLSLVLAVLSNTISITASILLFAPLPILGGAEYLSSFAPAQLQSLVLLSLKFYELAYGVSLIFFGFECLVTGYLMYRSTYFPRAIGVLLPIAGVCYLTNSFVNFMPPGCGDALFPWILMPCLVAEGSLSLWLLIVGVNSAKWNEIAKAQRALI